MENAVTVKLLKDIYPLEESVEITGIVRFRGNYVSRVRQDVSVLRKNDDLLKSHFIFLIDISYSMDDKSKIDMLKNSLKKFITNGYLDNSYVSIVTFGEKSEVHLDYIKVNENKSLIIDKITALRANEPKTYVYKGFREIFNTFKSYERNGINKVIYFTDGEDFDTNLAEEEAKKLIEGKKFTITSVGTGVEYNEAFLDTIATLGKGGFYHLSSVESFFDDIKDEIIQTDNEVITQSEITELFYPSNVQPIEVFKVGKGVTNLDIEDGRILCGNLTDIDKIYFKLKIISPKKDGYYNLLNATLQYNTGNTTQTKEFSFKVLLSSDKESLSNIHLEQEVIETNKQVIAYKKIKEAQDLYNMGKETEAKIIINEIAPIIKSFAEDDTEIEQLLSDLQHGKSLTSEMTRTLLSYTRTKTMTKSDTI